MGNRALAHRNIERFRIALSIFQVSAPTIQRGCPSMAILYTSKLFSASRILQLSLRETQKIVLNIRNFSIYAGPTDARCGAALLAPAS